MPLQYSQFIWGFEVFDSGTNQNNRLAFVRNGTTYDGAAPDPAATINAGIYTADELAIEVARAMNAAVSPSNTDVSCSFSYSTGKFTISIASPGNLNLLFSTGSVAATDCNVLVGFAAADRTGGGDNGDSFEGDSPVGGFHVIDSGASKNNRLAFSRKPDGAPSATVYDGDGANPAASLRAGFYTADELAAEVQRAMRERTGSADIFCTFSYGTLKFTIAIGEAPTPKGDLSLLWNSGTVAGTDCNSLLGYSSASNDSTDNGNNGDTYVGDSSVVAPPVPGPGVPEVWSVAEPLLYHSPVTAQAAGTGAKGVPRIIGALQNIADSGSVETVHFSNMKVLAMLFRALSTSEQTKMERFLDWIGRGARFTWQPDRSSTNCVKLIMASPGQVAATYEWLSRPEVGYGALSFFEQLT